QKQPHQQLARRSRSVLQSWLEEETAMFPASSPGKATSSDASAPPKTLKNGRARMGTPPDASRNVRERSPRKKVVLSRPPVCSSSNQKPSVKRPPERSRPSPPSKSTFVPGAPSTPASSRGVPAGLVVTSGGR